MCHAHLDYGGLLARYNENGSTNNMKVMGHADIYYGPWIIHHPQICM